jgi:cysteinyl-tRNA synthetase
MPLQLYNTLTRTKEEFVPVTPGHAGIYYCGPTVYSDPHLGHARGPVVFDVLKRWLEQQGTHVRLVSNITDVGHLTDDADEGEDKLLQRAVLERVEPMELADRYFWAYEDAMARLNVKRPDITPRASGHITEQIALIQELMRRGLAYESQGSVYFEVSKWDSYGVLSGRDGDDQISGTRVSVRDEKRDPRDFALWKHAEPEHIMRWPSPWGEGYPGWHIECSAMSLKYLGTEFDIHGGGMDLVFPHHEAEIAQSQGAGHAFARYWLHFNTITLAGEKMARSKDHFVLLRDLFERFDPIDVRFYLLRSHYRSVMDFTDESVASSTLGLRRLQDTWRLLLERPPEAVAGARHELIDPLRERFTLAMNDDLNTPQALAALFDAAREINRELGGEPAAQYLAAARALFDDLFGSVLGLTVQAAAGGAHDDAVLGGVIDLLLEQRNRARQERDFAGADRIRDRLVELGVIIEDTPEGSRWKLA